MAYLYCLQFLDDLQMETAMLSLVQGSIIYKKTTEKLLQNPVARFDYSVQFALPLSQFSLLRKKKILVRTKTRGCDCINYSIRIIYPFLFQQRNYCYIYHRLQIKIKNSFTRESILSFSLIYVIALAVAWITNTSTRNVYIVSSLPCSPALVSCVLLVDSRKGTGPKISCQLCT